jgi:hypothetical protein
MMTKLRVTVWSGQQKALPQAREGHRLAVLADYRIGPLAALHHLPLLEGVRRHDSAALLHRPTEHDGHGRGRQIEMTRTGHGWRRTTATSFVGAVFHDGARFGSGFTVPKMIKAVDSARHFLAVVDTAT